MNFLLLLLYSWQHIWLGHIPRTEKFQASGQPPLWGHQGLLPVDKTESDGEETAQHRSEIGPETPFGAGLRSQLSPASSFHEAHPPSQPLERGSVESLADSLGRLPPHPKVCMHSLLPSAKLVGPFGLRHLCSSASFPMPPVSGWYLVWLPTDFDISPSVWP